MNDEFRKKCTIIQVISRFKIFFLKFFFYFCVCYLSKVIECSTDGSCPCDVVLADHDPLGGTCGPRGVDQSSTVARLLTLDTPLNLVVWNILRGESGGEGGRRKKERESGGKDNNNFSYQ